MLYSFLIQKLKHDGNKGILEIAYDAICREGKMKYCHTCGHYLNGWCSVHNRGQSPAGSCRIWTGRSSTSKDTSKGKKTTTKNEAEKNCKSCKWYAGGICGNSSSPAHNKQRAPEASCPDYSRNSSNKNPKITPKDNGAHNNSDTQQPQVKDRREVSERCNRCDWFNDYKCSNRNSDHFGHEMRPTDWCHYFTRTIV